jgi:hypothetical protein
MKHVQSLLTGNTPLKTALVLLSFFAASLLFAVLIVAAVLTWLTA